MNTGPGTAHLLVKAEPAMHLRESIEDFAILAQTEKFTASGKPRGLRALIEAAALAHHYRDTVILSSPPPALQRLLLPLLARFGASNCEPAPVQAS
jgi:hypothetical protein